MEESLLFSFWDWKVTAFAVCYDGSGLTVCSAHFTDPLWYSFSP